MEFKEVIALLVLILIALIVTDCSVGKTRYCEGVVREHAYQPAYWSGSGKNSTHHSAEYHLLIWIAQPEHAVDLDVSLTNYTRYPDGAQVTVGERCGRVTGYPWLKWLAIKPGKPAQADY